MIFNPFIFTRILTINHSLIKVKRNKKPFKRRGKNGARNIFAKKIIWIRIKKNQLNEKLNNLELKTFTERIKNEAANKEISR